MITAAVIQARMGSTRLPGKVLMDVAGRAMLQRVYDRVRRAQLVDTVLVATSFAEADQEIVRFCQANRIPVARGGLTEDDVLGRFLDVASFADVIVRITADCPLIDPALIDLVVAHRADSGQPYVNNVDPRTYPDGLDVEAFTRQALVQADRETPWEEREHVSPWMRRQWPEGHLRYDGDLGHLKWSVDEEVDLAFVRRVYERLGDDFGWEAVLGVVWEHEV